MDNNVSTSGDTAVTSGTADTANTNVENTSTSGDESKSKADVHIEKILKESRNKSSKIEELEARLKGIEEKDLLANNQHKEVADLHREENVQLKATIAANTELLQKAKKVTAVKKHLVEMGLNPSHESLVLDKLLDVSDLVIDPETNVVLGAEEKAKRIRQDYAGLNIFGTSTTRTDQSAPMGQAVNKSINDMTQDEIRAQLKAMEG